MSKKLVLIYEGANSSSMVVDLKYVTDIIILDDDAPDLIDNTKGDLKNVQKKNVKTSEQKTLSQICRNKKT